MANRRFEMYEYRQIIVRMRLGESDRALANTGLIGRKKAKALRDIAVVSQIMSPVIFQNISRQIRPMFPH